MKTRKVIITCTQELDDNLKKTGKVANSCVWQADFSDYIGSSTETRDNLFAGLETFVQELKNKFTD